MVNDKRDLCGNTPIYIWHWGWKSGYVKNKMRLNSKIHLAVNERKISIKFIVTEETYADCKGSINLIKNIDANLVSADCVYNTNKILSYIDEQNMKLVILPKRSSIKQRGYACTLVCFRHIIQNDFLVFKYLARYQHSLH